MTSVRRIGNGHCNWLMCGGRGRVLEIIERATARKRLLEGNRQRRQISMSQTQSDDDSESEVCEVIKSRTHHFQEDWLREFNWLRYCNETNLMNCECCSRFPRTAGNTKFADSAGTSQFKHNTLVRHNLSLKHRVTC